MERLDREASGIIEIESADHGFMCEETDSFNEAASLIGWNLLIKEFN